MIAAYIRVSTRDQAESGLGAEAQRLAIGRWAAARYPDDKVVFFEEMGSAARIASRPVLADLLAHLADYTHLVVLRLDRLARNTLNLLQIVGTCKTAGCHLVAVLQDFNTDSPTGKILLTMLGAIAEFERDLISSRTREALAAKRARGEPLGRTPFGFLPGTRTPDPKTHPLIEKVIRLRAFALSTRRIARAVGLPETTVRRIIRAHAPPPPVL